jgi:hypothetical protein
MTIAVCTDMTKKKRQDERAHDGDAFIRESEQQTGSREDLSELLGEGFLRSATSGDDVVEEERDAVVPEELGGPFLESDGGEEFGRTVAGIPGDEEEERAAESAAFPEAVGALGVASLDERGARAPDDGEVLDEDEEEEDEEALQADAEVPSDLEPDSEVLEPETERSTAPKP